MTVEAYSIYKECIKIHSLRWLGEYQDLDPIAYLEFHAGPILSHFIGVYGIPEIVKDFISAATSER